MKYWLMKSEPEVFSLDDLKRTKTSLWDGVRNYQARNFMMADMTPGDVVLFYHSNTKPPGIAGLATVCEGAVPDPTALDPQSEYYDPKSTPEKPRWFCVRLRYKEHFKNYLSLDEIRGEKALQEMPLLMKGQRLSIQPVTKKQFDHICRLGQNGSR